MGPGTVCAAACTSDSCGDGLVCGEDGHCTLASCVDDGYACPSETVCAPEREGDGHGCAPSLCDAGDYECSSDTVCAPEREGDGHGCAPSLCDSEGYTCPEWMTCDPTSGADAHGCQFVHCSDGFECAANYDCDAASPTAPGCVRRSCSADTDCDCGACVFGRCEQHLFVCATFPA
jgi:hypothetical protein